MNESYNPLYEWLNNIYHQLQIKPEQASILEIHHDKAILYCWTKTTFYLRSGVIY